MAGDEVCGQMAASHGLLCTPARSQPPPAQYRAISISGNQSLARAAPMLNSFAPPQTARRDSTASLHTSSSANLHPNDQAAVRPDRSPARPQRSSARPRPASPATSTYSDHSTDHARQRAESSSSASPPPLPLAASLAGYAFPTLSDVGAAYSLGAGDTSPATAPLQLRKGGSAQTSPTVAGFGPSASPSANAPRVRAPSIS
jgi:hypothetical protein